MNTRRIVFALAAALTAAQFAAAGPPIDKPDLDVVCISRTPRYPSLHGEVNYVDLNKPYLRPEAEQLKKFFPEKGETVTFTAKFTNKGTRIEGQVEYCWKIDGQVIKAGAVEAPPYLPKPMYEPWATTSLEWVWQDGPHTVTFELDPNGRIDEFSRVNSTRTDRTDSLGFLFSATRDAYDDWNAEKNMIGTYSFEDWMNWHFDEMNRQFERAVYPSTPTGCDERVHVDTFVVVDTPDDMKNVDHSGYSGAWTFRHTQRKPGERAGTYDAGLIHELGHQLGLIDQYAIGFSLFNNRLLDKYGQPVMTGYVFWQDDSNMYSPGAMRWSELSACALNRQKGYPRGYFGTYLFDHADGYSIRVLDKAGKPLPNARVTYYRAVAGLTKQQEGRTDKNGIMGLQNDDTPRYKIPFSPFQMHPTPFGRINILGNNSILCFHVEANDQEDFVMSEAAWFLVNSWRSGAKQVTVDIPTTIGPANGPRPPQNVRASWTDDGKIRIRWDPVEDKRAPCTYNVYQFFLANAWAGRMNGPELAAERTDGAEVVVPCKGNSMRFFVTAVGENGLEGGASRRVWVTLPLRPNADVGIVYDRMRDRLILTGAWERVNSYSETAGFWPISYWLQTPRGAALDANANLLVALDGAHTSVRLLDLSSPTPSPELITYGERGPRSITFDKPRDVAVDGMGNVIVADTGNKRVVVLSPAGERLAQFGAGNPEGVNISTDSGPVTYEAPELDEPISVAVLPDGRIVIGEAKRGELVVGKIEEKRKTYTSLVGKFPRPVDLLVDSHQNLIVVDQELKTVSVLVPPNYVTAKVIGKDFARPTSAAIGKDGTLLVYDAGRTGMDAFVRIEGALPKDTTYYIESLSREGLRSFSVLPAKLQAEHAPSIEREAWHIVGPFDNPNMEGFDTEYPPEKEKRFDFKRSYTGVGGKIAWQILPVKGCPDGEFVNLDACFSPNDAVCAYAAATIISDEERPVRFLTGSDDTITVWLNGKKVLANNVLRAAVPAQDQTDVTLAKGDNRVLVKICEGGGGWGFYFRIVDPETNEPIPGVHFRRQ
jgi:hypothetical protein